MLTIGFVLLFVASLSLGSPAASEKPSITIPLQRRSAPASAINITELHSKVNSLVVWVLSSRFNLRIFSDLRSNSKYEAGIAAHNLNTDSVYPLSRELRSRSSTTEELKAENGDTMWQGLITVGNPTQTFAVSFDTGRADLVLPGRDCTTECHMRSKYDAQESSSSVDAGNFVFYDQEGGVRGEVYRDEIRLAGLSVSYSELSVLSELMLSLRSVIRPSGLH